MRYILSLAILLFAFTIISAQPLVRGKVIDATTKDGIPFVNIGFKKLAVGTVSDENGFYELRLVSPRDSVSISSIGYEMKTILAADLHRNTTVELTPKNYVFPEIEVVAEQWEEQDVKLGNHSEDMDHNVGFGSRQLGTEIGARITIERETYVKSAHFALNHAKGDSIRFRVNLYTFKEGKLGKNLLPKNVIIAAKQEKGLQLDVDLSAFNIVVDSDVLLALEWIKDDDGEGNVGITFQSSKSRKYGNLYTKETSFAEFRKLSDLVPRAPQVYVGFYLTGKQVTQ